MKYPRLKWSIHTFWVKFSDYFIVYNTLNKAVVRMSLRLKELIDSYLEGGVKDTRLERYVDELYRERFLVPEDLDEKEEFIDAVKRLNERLFEIVLLPTTACQLCCPYCYQAGIEEVNMSLDVAKRVVSWCEEYLDRHSFEEFRLVLYGGEPLLNWRVVKFVVPELYKLAHRKGVEYRLGIVTNGELLDLDKLNFFRKYNLNEVQITLDGPRDVHDSRRKRKDGRGTFDAIVRNIVSIPDGVRVKLRMNFDKQNVSTYPELFDFLAKSGLRRKVEVSFGPVTPTTCEIVEGTARDSYFEKFGFSREEVTSSIRWLFREAKKRDLRIPTEYPQAPLCTAKKTHSVVVLPDGGLTKCVCLVGRDDYVLGDVFSGEISSLPFDYEKCLERCFTRACPLIPICGGGCVLDEITLGSSCKMKDLKKINEELILLNFCTAF